MEKNLLDSLSSIVEECSNCDHGRAEDGRCQLDVEVGIEATRQELFAEQGYCDEAEFDGNPGRLTQYAMCYGLGARGGRGGE